MRQLPAFLILTLAAGCGELGLVGSGKQVAQTRAVGVFTKLEIAGGAQVSFTRGERALVVIGDDNLLDQLQTELRGDTLLVRLSQPIASGGLKAAISNDALEALGLSGGSRFTGAATATPSFDLAVSGGSTAELTDLASSHLAANVSGASLVTLTRGAAASVAIAASGGSRVTSDCFTAEEGVIDASGASTVNVRLTRAITANASGASTITVAGSPQTVVVNASGGSRLVNQN